MGCVDAGVRMGMRGWVGAGMGGRVGEWVGGGVKGCVCAGVGVLVQGGVGKGVGGRVDEWGTRWERSGALALGERGSVGGAQGVGAGRGKRVCEMGMHQGRLAKRHNLKKTCRRALRTAPRIQRG